MLLAVAAADLFCVGSCGARAVMQGMKKAGRASGTKAKGMKTMKVMA